LSVTYQRPAPAPPGDVIDAEVVEETDHRDAERNKVTETKCRDAEERDARTFVAEHVPDLAAQVGDGLPFRTFVEAQFAWQRNREEAQRIAKAKATAEKAAADEKRGMTDLYSGIARGLQIVGGYGGYATIDTLMEKYSVEYLDPPQYEREFSAENLRNARRFVDNLINWQESRAPVDGGAR